MRIEDIYTNLPTLDTERLVLRKLTIDDVDDMFRYASLPEVTRCVPWETHQTQEDTKQFLDFVLQSYQNNILAPWGIELKESGKIIGTIDFVQWLPRHQRAEIGFILSKEYWGNGMILEAANKVIQFGFENMDLNKIEAPCMLENVQSQRVLQKLGMKLEGVLRSHWRIKGKYRDMATYSILKDEWIRC